MEKAILTTLKYFYFFSYPVTLDELHLFLVKKADVEELRISLMALVNKKKVKYTLGKYSIEGTTIKDISHREILSRQAISKNKLKKISLYLRLLSLFPQIKLIGISGSLAMLNAQPADDVDLFIITAQGRLWTGRMIALTIAQLLRIRRKIYQKKAKDKVCLNLFFDLKNLVVPFRKRNLYVSHEILQMKPLVDKDNTYVSFMQKNKWVSNFLPNFSCPEAPQVNKKKYSSIMADWIEAVLKRFQLAIIKRHRTKELITNNQLWFFPQDFQEKIVDMI